MISDKTMEQNVAEEMGINRFTHVKTMKAYAMKYGKCKEAYGGICSYPHCQCLFIGLEENQVKK